MPWTQFSPEPGDYLAERETGEIDLFRREKDDTIVTTAPPATRWRRFLPIPPPSVLLAMEKFIAAERARRKQRNKEVKCVGGYMASDVMVERAHAQHIADAEWYALARAEAEAKEGKP